MSIQSEKRNLTRMKSDSSFSGTSPEMKVGENLAKSPPPIISWKSTNSLYQSKEKNGENSRKQSVNSLISNLTRYDQMQYWLDNDYSATRAAIQNRLTEGMNENQSDPETMIKKPMKTPLIKVNDGINRSMSVPDLHQNLTSEKPRSGLLPPIALPKENTTRSPKDLRRGTIAFGQQERSPKDLRRGTIAFGQQQERSPKLPSMCDHTNPREVIERAVVKRKGVCCSNMRLKKDSLACSTSKKKTEKVSPNLDSSLDTSNTCVDGREVPVITVPASSTFRAVLSSVNSPVD